MDEVPTNQDSLSARTSPPVLPSPPASGRRGWTAGGIVCVVVGAVLALCSLGVLGAGATAWWADGARHDGYVDLGTGTYASSGYAVESTPIQLPGSAGGWDPVRGFVGTVRVTATAVSGTTPVFIGIAPAQSADRYLSGIARDTVTNFNGVQGVTTAHSGAAPSVPPTRAGIWVARATGRGAQTLSWRITGGDWIVVAMNGDGSRQVNVQVDVAAELPELAPIAAGLLIGGLMFLALSIALILIPVRASGRCHPPAVGARRRAPSRTHREQDASGEGRAAPGRGNERARWAVGDAAEPVLRRSPARHQR